MRPWPASLALAALLALACAPMVSAAGADTAFDTTDDVLFALAASPAYTGGVNVELAIAAGPLPAGQYRFTGKTDLVDLSGNPLDGNGDRTAATRTSGTSP